MSRATADTPEADQADPLIDEVRAIRARQSAAFGSDARAYAAHLKQLADSHPRVQESAAIDRHVTYFGAIRREHILAAIDEVRAGRMHGFGEPVRYYIEHEGSQFPAKAVLGIARQLATGESTNWSDFKGGYKLEPTFRRLGFHQVVRDR